MMVQLRSDQDGDYPDKVQRLYFECSTSSVSIDHAESEQRRCYVKLARL